MRVGYEVLTAERCAVSRLKLGSVESFWWTGWRRGFFCTLLCCRGDGLVLILFSFE